MNNYKDMAYIATERTMQRARSICLICSNPSKSANVDTAKEHCAQDAAAPPSDSHQRKAGGKPQANYGKARAVD